MNIRKLILCTLLPATVLLLSSCFSDDDPQVQAPQTTTELVQQEIANNTADPAAPLPINDLPIAEDDTSETALPQAI